MPKYIFGTILYIIRPLYSFAEASVYWFYIYYSYYINKFGIKTLIYDLCLIIAKKNNCFGFIAMQTNNIFILSIKEFLNLKKKKI